MAIEAITATAVKEITAAKAIESAQQQLIQKLANSSMEQAKMSRLMEQTYATNNFGIEEISMPEIKDKEILKQREFEAANELNAKIELPTVGDYKDLLPNNIYKDNGNIYRTDYLGRISTWEADLKINSAERISVAQYEVGGSDRLNKDENGHLVAHMNGGGSSCVNLVPMRDCLNRGDYKKCELEENQMLQDGKSVHEFGKINYDGESRRPAIIEKSYTDGDKYVEAKFDNRKGSTELVDDLKKDVSSDDYQSLVDEISSMKKDGHEVSVISIKNDYNAERTPTKVTVGVRDETAGQKEYKTYLPVDGVNK